MPDTALLQTPLSPDAEMSSGHEPLTIDLREASAYGPALVGGKAMSLSTLLSLGFEVPEGFVITTAALRRASTLERLETDQPWPDSAREIPADITHAIRQFYETKFGGRHPRLVVRSSGVSEDSASASFAGQFESVLNVGGIEEVLVAVRRCWASQFLPAVAAYRQRHDPAGDASPEMAVVVQCLIDADAAGALFTMDPLTGREENVVVEATQGLGDILLSGAADADRYVIDVERGRVRSMRVAEKHWRSAPAVDGGVERLSVSPEEAKRPSLSIDQVRRLAAAGKRIQEHYGRPMDIEWAMKDGCLHILQARPITSLQFAPETGQWTTADFRDGGVSSAVCSPFMWSLYQRAFQTALPRFMQAIRIRRDAEQVEWVRLFFGRPYWNLAAVKDTLAQLPGYRERDFDEDLGIVPTYEGPGRSTAISAGAVVRALPLLLHLPLRQRQCLRKIDRFAQDFATRKSAFDLEAAALAAMGAGEFADRYEALCSFQFETETAYFETIFNTSIAKLTFCSAMQAVHKATGIEPDESTLLGGLLDLSHTGPCKDLYRAHAAGKPLRPTLETARAFAQRWPQHGRKELDIRAPRWPEDLPFVVTLMGQAFAAFDKGHDPFDQERAQHERYCSEYRRVIAAIGARPFLRLRFLSALRRMRRYAWWREEMRDCSSHLYALMRRWSLEAGRRLSEDGYLVDAEDVWALPCRDVLKALRGTAGRSETLALASKGCRAMAAFRNFEAPGEIGARFSAVHDDLASDAMPERLQGTPCSSGGVTARARVVTDLEGADALEDGEILVTRFTDPGWTLLFPKLAGVVTETGGVLSHAAVISREFGIPAVLGVAGATRHIHDGDRLLIDGASGSVAILERAAPLPT